jgi:hypothetical protein
VVVPLGKDGEVEVQGQVKAAIEVELALSVGLEVENAGAMGLEVWDVDVGFGGNKVVVLLRNELRVQGGLFGRLERSLVYWCDGSGAEPRDGSDGYVGGNSGVGG